VVTGTNLQLPLSKYHELVNYSGNSPLDSNAKKETKIYGKNAYIQVIIKNVKSAEL
jgi:hypothetical protein